MEEECEINGGPSYLPQELVTEILTYLPVKSLIQFTGVCKAWLHIIKNDHQFAMKHYVTRATSSSRILDNVDCLLNYENSGKICMYSFTQAKTLRTLMKFECPNISLVLQNSCHGIICLRLHMRSGISRILLCNPLIQEVVLLPAECPNKEELVLGFDPFNNDYKIVAIEGAWSSPCSWIVTVYSVRYRQRRNVNASSSLQHVEGLNCHGHVALNANGRMCNWFASFESALVSFDMVEEIFRELPMPECVDPRGHSHELLSSCRWQACFSCLSRHYFPGFVNLWVLRGSTWSKDVTIKFPENEPIHPLNFWLNDMEILVYIQRGNIEEVFHYNLHTQQLKRIGRHGLPHIFEGYIESLVSIKHLMLPHHDFKVEGVDVGGDASNKQDTSAFIFCAVPGRKCVGWSCRL